MDGVMAHAIIRGFETGLDQFAKRKHFENEDRRIANETQRLGFEGRRVDMEEQENAGRSAALQQKARKQEIADRLLGDADDLLHLAFDPEQPFRSRKDALDKVWRTIHSRNIQGVVDKDLWGQYETMILGGGKKLAQDTATPIEQRVLKASPWYGAAANKVQDGFMATTDPITGQTTYGAKALPLQDKQAHEERLANKKIAGDMARTQYITSHRPAPAGRAGLNHGALTGAGGLVEDVPGPKSRFARQ